MEKFSEEITYTPSVSNHSSYIMRNVTPQGSNSVTLSTSGVVGPVEFILPPAVMNLSKSRLEFSLQLGGVASKNTCLNANLNTIINRIVCYSSSTNAVICDVSNFNLFTSMLNGPSTHIDKFLTKATYATSAGVTDSLPVTPDRTMALEDISKCNTDTAANGKMSTLSYTSGVNAAAYVPSLTNRFSSRKINYVNSTKSGTAANNNLGIEISLPLESLSHTIFSVNRNLYFPENIIAQIYFNNSDNFSFVATGTGDVTYDGLASVASASISNLNILLAQEQNLAIVSQTIDRVMKGPGISLPFTYPTITRQVIDSSSPSYQLQLTKAYGQRILGICTSVFGQVGYLTNAHGRIPDKDGSTLNQYNTFINSVPLKYAAGIDCTKSEDYLLNKPYFDKSVIQVPYEYIYSEWFHFDSFVGEKPLWKVNEDQTDVDGLDVSNASSTWQFQGTLSASDNYTYVSTILGQKILTITSAGAMVM
jgi:hypothetical protein